jgi:hypothetical protein
MKNDIEKKIESIFLEASDKSATVANNIVEECIVKIFEIQERLQEEAKDFSWKGLGNLLGDYGEYLAARDFDIKLAPKGTKDYDATDAHGRTVQIKACLHSKQVSFRGKAQMLLVLGIRRNGDYDQIYTGPFEALPDGSWSGTDTKHVVQRAQLESANNAVLIRVPVRPDAELADV